MPDDVFLLRFADGPLARRGGGQTTIPQDLFGWPLPRRLNVLSHVSAANVAMWDADEAPPAGLPSVITESPSRVVYVKVSESQLPKDVSHVVRCAEYELQTATPV